MPTSTDVPGPVPLIVDTDIFSNADDVTALAIALGLQLKGEAKVIAINVNTRTDRPSVATNSWKCAAAVAQFYGSGNIPIGSDTPSNGTSVNDPDFIGPCATLASASTSTPDTAVNVYRRALASQPDGSVVIAGIGYSENLSALLNSPADSISPLTGHDLVAKKVKTLVIMAGGYPSRSWENNLVGNPAAAQNVATNWPTKIVWSGYEVGAVVYTGETVSATHPANSPVRVSLEAYVGPNNWIYSYDLTAVYYAIRPSDPLLTEIGPGTNVIHSTGGNTFTMGAGNQYYLTVPNPSSLASAIEALLDILPRSATRRDVERADSAAAVPAAAPGPQGPSPLCTAECWSAPEWLAATNGELSKRLLDHGRGDTAQLAPSIPPALAVLGTARTAVTVSVHRSPVAASRRPEQRPWCRRAPCARARPLPAGISGMRC